MSKLISYIKNQKTNLLLILISWIFYSITISQNYSLSHDSTYYLNDLENGGWIFHPHHLLFHILAKIWSSLINLIPILNYLDISYKVGILNSLFGSLILAYLYNKLQNIFNFNKLNALLVVIIIGTNWAFWYYSGCFEVYIIPLYFILIYIFSFYDFLIQKSSITKSIIFISLATLFHQSNIMLIFAMIVAVIFLTKANKISNILRISGISFLIVGVPYLIIGIFYYGHTSISSFYNWLILYSNIVPEHWSTFGLKMLLGDIVGFSRTFFTTYFIYSIDFFRAAIIDIFRNQSLVEEIFLVREMSVATGLFLTFLVILYSVLIIKSVITNFKLIKSKFIENKRFFSIILINFTILSIFFTFWSSTNLEFWIPMNVAFLLSYFILINKNSKSYTIF